MRKWLAIAAMLVFLQSLGNAQTEPPHAERYRVALEAVWKTTQENFYDPSLLGVDWDAIGRQYRARLPQVRDDDTFVRLIRAMLRQIPSSHLDFRDLPGAGDVGLPLRLRKIKDKQIAFDVGFASDARRQGLREGEAILSDPDGLRGPWGSAAEVRVEGCDGKRKTLMMRREPYGWPPARPSVRWQLLRPSPTVKIGYMQVPHFDFAATVDQAMAEMHDASALIIDLRNNQGGNASFVRLLSYFTREPRMVFALLSRPYLNRFGRAPATMDKEMVSRLPKVTGAYTTEQIISAFRKNGGGAAFYTEDVGTHAYHGRIVVLINQETASAAEGFAAILRGMSNTTIVGEPTAGAVVGAESFPIPGGWTLILPTHAAWLPDGTTYRDQKTIPDISIPLKRDDLCGGTDPVLVEAIKIATGRGATASR